jgi:hypothetical protein
VLADLQHGIDADHHRGGREQRAKDVGALVEPEALVVLDVAQRQQRGRDADRDVDEEDPVPADRLGQRAACQQADRGTGGCHEAVDADRLGLLPRLREHRHDHAEDHSGGERAADPLDEARGDQESLARREPAGERRGGEEGEAEQEHAAAPDQVAEAPGEQQQAAEGDQVAVHDPGQARLREAEVGLDRR